MSRLERSITTGLLARLNTHPSVYAIKLHATAEQGAGHPDIIGVANGRALAIEVKRPDGPGARKLQQYELAQWGKAGAIATVATSLEDIDRIIAEALR